ncbi:helix-turn-helix transcriptional regulator (plasmid) [Halobacillus litoralis]|uniref:helix-turn-helix domain-containing protein n=1 Tax=Halobacillus litoralis TaxID=45668 RepID=UPI001CFDCD5D|nr:helix-turn-helix transcriptional regulator [Halobacillus litoralis]WLR49608.1 helix-turn-helix transcriptional regulator [Halobacillus litoralis]
MDVGKKKTSLSPKERASAINRWAEAGQFVRDSREKYGISARGLGAEIDVSGNYISEIERGIKPASDPVIREIAQILKFDEADLFKLYGKPTLRAQEELEGSDKLNDILESISKNVDSKDIKDDIYEEFAKIADKYIK